MIKNELNKEMCNSAGTGTVTAITTHLYNLIISFKAIWLILRVYNISRVPIPQSVYIHTRRKIAYFRLNKCDKCHTVLMFTSRACVRM